MSVAREDIIKHFVKQVGEKGKKPESIYAFMDSMDADEKTFHEYFQSIKDLEKNTWLYFMETTLTRIQAEEAYTEYSVREKMLSFLFTLVEMLKPDREFVRFYRNTRPKGFRITPDYMVLAYEYFVNWAKQIIEEGTETGEIADRSLINQKYADGLWLMVLSSLRYWMEDRSEDYDKTDTFIEKYVNFNFDMLGVTPLDSGIDLFRFVIQEVSQKVRGKKH